MKANGWILSYTIILMLISVLTLSSMIVVLGFQTQLFSIEFNQQKLELNKLSGLNIYLSNDSIDEFNFTIKKFEDNFKIERTKWGHLELLKITSYAGVDSLINHVLIGSKPLKTDPILILNESPHALKLSGLCKMTGTINIPNQGIETLNKLYSPSHIDMNAVHIEPKNRIQPIPQKSLYPFDFSYIDDITSPNQLYSFKNKTSYYFSDHSIELTNNIQGNVFIESSKIITITSKSNLTDVIIKAPTVKIENNWSGKLQIITDNLLLGRNISLQYPSAITINNINNNSLFHFNSTCTLNGLLNLNSSKALITPPQINGEINGYIYSNTPLDFSGNLSGQISCPSFKHITKSTSYINLIYNSTITDKFQQKDITIPIILKKHPKGFIKWLN